MLLILIKCLGPTFSETEFPPHDPHPKVNDGANLKLNKSPMAPWAAGILINVLAVFILSPNVKTLSLFLTWSV